MNLNIMTRRSVRAYLYYAIWLLESITFIVAIILSIQSFYLLKLAKLSSNHDVSHIYSTIIPALNTSASQYTAADITNMYLKSASMVSETLTASEFYFTQSAGFVMIFMILWIIKSFIFQNETEFKQFNLLRGIKTIWNRPKSRSH